MTVENLQQARARFAKNIQQQGQIKSAGLIEGLATVPRENFVRCDIRERRVHATAFDLARSAGRRGTTAYSAHR